MLFKYLIAFLSLYTLSASAWRVRFWGNQSLNSLLVNRFEINSNTDRCFNFPSQSSNKATFYDYIAGMGSIPNSGRACRLRVYDNFGCSGSPFIDTWQDVSRHRINAPNNNIASSYYIDCVPNIG